MSKWRTVSGRVLIAGKGRAGVGVSNGEIVTRTGPGGGYELPVRRGRHRFVYVIVPDDAAAREPFFKRTGELPADADGVAFHLAADPKRRRRNFTFAHITDMHLHVDGVGPRFLKSTLGKAFATGLPDFAVLTGDLTQRGDLPSLEAWRRAMRACPCPYYPMFGGHDGNTERHWLGYKRTWTRHFESVIGPTSYSFDYGGRHFVLYHNEDFFYSPTDLQVKQRWLASDLKAHAGRPTLLFVHNPPPTDFLDRLMRTDVRAVFHGDTHAAKAYRYRGIDVFLTQPFLFGASDMIGRGYRSVTFHRGAMKTQFVPVRHRGYEPARSKPRPAHRGRWALRLLWTRRLDTMVHRGAPVMDGKRVLMSLRDDERIERQGVVALDVDSGRVVWRLRTDSSINNSVALGSSRAAVLSVAGELTAFNPRSGKKVWSKKLPFYPQRYMYASPVIAGKSVFAGGKDGYGAYDLGSGKQRWYRRPDAHIPYGIKWCSFAGPLVIDDLLIIPAQERGLLALDTSSGRRRWCVNANIQPFYPQPVVSDGDVIAAVNGGEIVRVRPALGRVRQRRTVTNQTYICSLAATAGHLLITTPDGYCRALSEKSGRTRWQTRVGLELLDIAPDRWPWRIRGAYGGPITTGNYLALGANDGHLYLLDADTGRQIDRWSFAAPLTTAPCVHEDRLIVASYDGLVACFEIR